MTVPSLSVHLRLTLFMAAFVAIVMGLSAITAISLISIDHKIEAVDQKWLISTAMLGEWTDRISEFRLADTYRTNASIQPLHLKYHGREVPIYIRHRVSWPWHRGDGCIHRELKEQFLVRLGFRFVNP